MEVRRSVNVSNASVSSTGKFPHIGTEKASSPPRLLLTLLCALSVTGGHRIGPSLLFPVEIRERPADVRRTWVCSSLTSWRQIAGRVAAETHHQRVRPREGTPRAGLSIWARKVSTGEGRLELRAAVGRKAASTSRLYYNCRGQGPPRRLRLSGRRRPRCLTDSESRCHENARARGRSASLEAWPGADDRQRLLTLRKALSGGGGGIVLPPLVAADRRKSIADTRVEAQLNFVQDPRFDPRRVHQTSTPLRRVRAA